MPYCGSCPCDRHDLFLPSIPASLQTLGRFECVAACALAPLGLRVVSPLTFYLSFLGAIWTYDKNLAPIFPSHIYIYRPPSCPKVCQTVGPFPISEFARLRSFTFHHPPRVCQTVSSSKSFHQITEQRPATFFNDVFASPVVFFCGLPGPRQDRVHDPQVIHHPDSPLGGSHGFL